MFSEFAFIVDVEHLYIDHRCEFWDSLHCESVVSYKKYNISLFQELLIICQSSLKLHKTPGSIGHGLRSRANLSCPLIPRLCDNFLVRLRRLKFHTTFF